MKKWLMVTVFTISMILFGCSDGDEDKTAVTSNNVDSEETTEQEKEEQKNITVSASPKEVQERYEQLKNNAQDTLWFEGTYDFESEYKIGDEEHSEKGSLLFQSTTQGDLFQRLTGNQAIDGTEQKVDMFKLNTQDRYIYNAETNVYEKFGVSHLGYPFQITTRGPAHPFSMYLANPDLFYSNTTWEDDGETTVFTTDLTADSSFANLATNQLMFHYNKNLYAEISKYQKNKMIKEGTYKLYVNNENPKLVKIEWDFVLTSEAFDGNTLSFDYKSAHEYTAVDENQTFEAPQDIINSAVEGSAQ